MLNVLCLNQATARSSQVLGPVAAEEALRVGLDGRAEATFARMSPWKRGARTLARPIPGLYERNLDLYEFRWHVAEAARGYAALERMRRRRPFDVVHVTSHTLAFGMGTAMREVPIFVSADATVLSWARMGIWTQVRPHTELVLAPSIALERRCLLKADTVLAWTAWAAEALRAAAPAARVVEHHPGLDVGRYKPAARRDRVRPRILFVGGRFREKGGEDLLAALGSMIGRELELDVVTQQAVPVREGLRVHKLGRDDPMMVDLFQQADLLCLPTYGDAAPWVILEAMACGTPVISTSVGAIDHFLEDGRCGITLKPGDTRGLREAVAALIGDSTRRVSLGRRGRARVEERYNARTQGAVLLGLMNDAIERRSASIPSTPRSDAALVAAQG